MLFFIFAMLLSGITVSKRPPVFDNVESTYYIAKEVQGQDKARELCESRSSSGLMKIESEDELAEITYILDPLTDYWEKYIWVDGVYNKNLLEWQWTGGETMDSFPGLWCDGFPTAIDPFYLYVHNNYAEKCALLRSTLRNVWCLVNVDCHVHTNYICEHYPSTLNPSNVNIQLVDNASVTDEYVQLTEPPRKANWHHPDHSYAEPTEPAVVYSGKNYGGTSAGGNIDGAVNAFKAIFG